MVDFSRDSNGDPRAVFRAPDAATFLGVSRATFYRMDNKGQVPRPVYLGKCRRWRIAELQAWLEQGCPPRDRWEEMNQ